MAWGEVKERGGFKIQWILWWTNKAIDYNEIICGAPCSDTLIIWMYLAEVHKWKPLEQV